MNILITGGAGFIGSHLTEKFLSGDQNVVVIDNLLTSSIANISKFNKNPKFNFIKADVSNTNFVKQLQNIKFDLVYHLASPASPVQYEKYPLETLKANSVGVENVLEHIVKRDKAGFVFASTSEIYGDPLIHPQIETYWGNVNSFGPRSCYDEAKRFGEALCFTYLKKYNLNIRVARIFNTYGPNMEKNDGRVISNFIVQALMNQPLSINGTGSQTRSFCYVTDLVNGLYKLGTKNVKGEVINLGNPEEYSIKEIATIILSLTTSKATICYKPLPKDDPQKRKPNIEKAQRLLDWQPKVNLEEGLKATIFYFKNLLSK
jgi:nucleoside-diphosphate-sugar epimerase